MCRCLAQTGTRLAEQAVFSLRERCGACALLIKRRGRRIHCVSTPSLEGAPEDLAPKAFTYVMPLPVGAEWMEGLLHISKIWSALRLVTCLHKQLERAINLLPLSQEVAVHPLYPVLRRRTP